MQIPSANSQMSQTCVLEIWDIDIANLSLYYDFLSYLTVWILKLTSNDFRCRLQIFLIGWKTKRHMSQLLATSLLHSRKSSNIFERDQSSKSGFNYLMVDNQVLSYWSKYKLLPDLGSLIFSPINSTSLPKVLLYIVMQITLINCFSLSSTWSLTLVFWSWQQYCGNLCIWTIFSSFPPVKWC